jgi:16S rRNA (adenine1518-N6/adenine1519-N6)-dimethyltransferase
MTTHVVRKRLGQHFLHEAAVVGRIVQAFDPRPGDWVVEIGPGEGVLTRALAPRVAALHAVEVDRRLVARLTAEFGPYDNVVIHHADALGFDFCKALGHGRKLRLIGNLPYSISTALLFRVLEQAHCIEDMCFMLQREVVERLCATPGSKTYGRLSVMIQWRCQVQRLFNVKPGAFRPPPKVDSTIVRLRPYTVSPLPVKDDAILARLVQVAFAQRRKTLRNAIKSLLGPDQLLALGIDPRRRPETLTLGEFAELANALARTNQPLTTPSGRRPN